MKNLKESEKVRQEREAQTMMRLNHPFLIRCYDAFSEGEYLSLVLEYAEEGNLDAFIKRRRD